MQTKYVIVSYLKHKNAIAHSVNSFYAEPESV
jgi:hypothetical protein